MRKELLVYGSSAIESDELEELVAVMRSSWIGTGLKVAWFERKFAKFKAIKYAVTLR